jgi:drug/metabolite transporter (DMT)-like permease
MPRTTAIERFGGARAIGVGMMLLAGCFLSISGLIVRHIETASGWQVMFYRAVGMTTVLLLILAAKQRGRVVAPFRAMGWSGLFVATVLASSLIFYLFALTLTAVANVMFIISAGPFFAAVLGWILLKERVAALTWAAIAAAVGGMAIMFADGFASGRPIGLIVALCAVVTYAFVFVLLRRLRHLDMLPALIAAAIIAGIVSAFAADGLAISRHDMLLSLVMGAVQSAGGFGFIMLGARRVPAAEGALLLLNEPILAPLWVWIFVNEVPSTVALVGGAIVFGAVLVQALAALLRERRAAVA